MASPPIDPNAQAWWRSPHQHQCSRRNTCTPARPEATAHPPTIVSRPIGPPKRPTIRITPSSRRLSSSRVPSSRSATATAPLESGKVMTSMIPGQRRLVSSISGGGSGGRGCGFNMASPPAVPERCGRIRIRLPSAPALASITCVADRNCTNSPGSSPLSVSSCTLSRGPRAETQSSSGLRAAAA